jgi:hypothetical protein
MTTIWRGSRASYKACRRYHHEAAALAQCASEGHTDDGSTPLGTRASPLFSLPALAAASTASAASAVAATWRAHSASANGMGAIVITGMGCIFMDARALCACVHSPCSAQESCARTPPLHAALRIQNSPLQGLYRIGK